ncbi:putative WD repeat-containing protein [Diplonema papillatum]|nr:putative WD repeat-containing protein [Diplonema papillatum]
MSDLAACLMFWGSDKQAPLVHQPTHVVVSPENDCVVVRDEVCGVSFWSSSGGELRPTGLVSSNFGVGKVDVMCHCTHMSRPALAVITEDGSLIISDIRDGSHLTTRPYLVPNALSASPLPTMGSPYIIVGDTNCLLTIINTDTLESPVALEVPFPGFTIGLTGHPTSSDTVTLAAVSADKMLRHWTVTERVHPDLRISRVAATLDSTVPLPSKGTAVAICHHDVIPLTMVVSIDSWMVFVDRHATPAVHSVQDSKTAVITAGSFVSTPEGIVVVVLLLDGSFEIFALPDYLGAYASDTATHLSPGRGPESCGLESPGIFPPPVLLMRHKPVASSDVWGVMSQRDTRTARICSVTKDRIWVADLKAFDKKTIQAIALRAVDCPEGKRPSDAATENEAKGELLEQAMSVVGDVNVAAFWKEVRHGAGDAPPPDTPLDSSVNGAPRPEVTCSMLQVAPPSSNETAIMLQGFTTGEILATPVCGSKQPFRWRGHAAAILHLSTLGSQDDVPENGSTRREHRAAPDEEQPAQHEPHRSFLFGETSAMERKKAKKLVSADEAGVVCTWLWNDWSLLGTFTLHSMPLHRVLEAPKDLYDRYQIELWTIGSEGNIAFFDSSDVKLSLCGNGSGSKPPRAVHYLPATDTLVVFDAELPIANVWHVGTETLMRVVENDDCTGLAAAVHDTVNYCSETAIEADELLHYGKAASRAHGSCVSSPQSNSPSLSPNAPVVTVQPPNGVATHAWSNVWGSFVGAQPHASDGHLGASMVSLRTASSSTLGGTMSPRGNTKLHAVQKALNSSFGALDRSTSSSSSLRDPAQASPPRLQSPRQDTSAGKSDKAVNAFSVRVGVTGRSITGLYVSIPLLVRHLHRMQSKTATNLPASARMLLSYLLRDDDHPSVLELKQALRLHRSPKPAAAIGFTQNTATKGLVVLPMPDRRKNHAYDVSSLSTSRRLVSILSLLYALCMDSEALKPVCKAAINFYASSLPSELRSSELAYEADFFWCLDSIKVPLKDIQFAARCALNGVLRLGSNEELSNLVKRLMSTIKHPVSTTEQIHVALLGTAIMAVQCPTILSTSGSEVVGTACRGLLSVATSTAEETNPTLRATALALLSDSYAMWAPVNQHPVTLLKVLLAMATTQEPYQNIGSDFAKCAFRAFINVGVHHLNVFFSFADSVLSDIQTPRDDDALPYQNCLLTAIAQMIKKYTQAFVPFLLRVSLLFLKALDPHFPKIRDKCMHTSTNALKVAVATYPMMSFHQAKQSLAVGDVTGQAVVWDMKTATKWFVWDAHQSAVSCIAFSTMGDQMVTFAFKEHAIKVWSADMTLLAILSSSHRPRLIATMDANTKDRSAIPVASDTLQVRINWLSTHAVELVIQNEQPRQFEFR